jgi:UDP-glucose 4-epimerase
LPYSEAYPPGFEDMHRRVPDVSKLEMAIGFRPTTPLETIIADVVEYERSQRQAGRES